MKFLRRRRQARCSHESIYGYLPYGAKPAKPRGIYCARCDGYLGTQYVLEDGTRIDVEVVGPPPEDSPVTVSELSRLTPTGAHGGLNRTQRRAAAKVAARRARS